MYARLVRFSCDPGGRNGMQAIADGVAPLIAQQPGCESVTVFGDQSGEYGLFVLWDSQPHADAAAPLIRPQLDQHLAGHLTSSVDARLFEVLS